MGLPALLERLMPSSRADRIHPKDPFWRGKRKQFFIATISSFILLQILFLGNLSYLYGSLFESNNRVHNINVLMVDYDGGTIGESLRQASEQLTAASFPTIIEIDTAEYPDVADVVEAVRNGDYWAAVYTHANASNRRAEALQGGQAAASYNSSDAITYVWDEARYVAVQQGFVSGNLQRLITMASAAYNQANGLASAQSVNTSDAAAVRTLLNSITPSSINLMPMPHGTRVLLNTVTMVMPILMQFFFLMAINGISAPLQLFSRLPVRTNAFVRSALGLTYTFVGALCAAGYIWAFRETWAVDSNQFALTWMILWLYMHINFRVLDCATAFIPQSFIAFFMLTWVILNVASTIFPFELNPGFYRWGYALPAHEVWSVLITIWTHGAVNDLHIALPILFAWEVLLWPISILALQYRCADAAKQANMMAPKNETGEEKEEKVEIDEERGGHEETGGEREGTQTPHTPDSSWLNRASAMSTERDYYPSTPVPWGEAIERFTSR